MAVILSRRRRIPAFVLCNWHELDCCYACAPWHFLYFLLEPQGQGSLRPTFSPVTRGELPLVLEEVLAARAASSSRLFFRSNSRSSASMVVEGALFWIGTAGAWAFPRPSPSSGSRPCAGERLCAGRAASPGSALPLAACPSAEG